MTTIYQYLATCGAELLVVLAVNRLFLKTPFRSLTAAVRGRVVIGS